MIYIIFTGTIVRMGGAQKYVSNKVKFMQGLGWKVYVFSGVPGTVMIPPLEPFSGSIIPELEYLPNLYPAKKREEILTGILDTVQASSDEKIVIESNTAHISVWAELAAEKLGAQHFIFLLDERYNIDRGFTDFFRYKFRRRELAIIKKEYFDTVLGKDYDASGCDKPVLNATSNDVVEDIRDPRFEEIPYDDYDDVICSFGRLDKKYMPNVITGFREYALSCPDRKIAFLFIGSQPNGFVPDMNALIDKTLGDLANANVYRMGYVYPVPRSVMPHLSAGVASAGSSKVLWGFNVPTISMDARDGLPIGILGYTTSNSLMREDEEQISLAELLRMILTDHALADKAYTPYLFASYKDTFKTHLAFIERLPDDKEYYAVADVRPQNRKNRMKKFLISLFGYRRTKKIIGRLIHNDSSSAV